MGDHQPALDSRPFGEEGRQARRGGRPPAARCGAPRSTRARRRPSWRSRAPAPAARRGSCRREITSPVGEDERVVGGGVDLDARGPAPARRARRARRRGPAACSAGCTASWTRCVGVGPVRCPDLAAGSSSRRCRPTATCPGAAARRSRRSSNAAPVPSIASRLMAPMTSAVSARRIGVVVRQRADAGHQLRPVEEREPLLGAQLDRLEAGPRQRLAAGPGPAPSTVASPSPMSTSAMCASGARSPDAPRLPRDGTTGWTAALSIATSSSTRSARTPEQADRQGVRAQERAWRARPRPGSGSPTPAAWERTRLRCSSAVWSGLDPDVGQVAEAGRHAIDGRAVGNEALDRRRAMPRIRSAAAGSSVDGPPAARDLDDVVDGEVPAGERKGRHRSLYYAPCDGCRTP